MQQPEYLEIYPSEVAANKISKHLDKMLETRPRVYRKTILRYRKLAYLLLECVTKIVKLLQTDEMQTAMLLSSASSEFEEIIDADQVDELRASVDDLSNLIDKAPSRESRKLAGDTIKKYKSVFAQAAERDFGYIEPNECAYLLNYWITKRFSGVNSNFKYQIKQIPIWSTYIVIAYGKYHSLGYSGKFMQEFKEWCDSLDSDLHNCWALPYNVFNMTKVVDPTNFTEDAMIIYDMLIDGCLYQLVDAKIPMDAAYVAKLVKEYHPDKAHNVRTRITKQAKLASILNFRSSSDAVEEEA